MKALKAIIFSFVFPILITAQVPVGSWRSHLPCNNVVQIAYATDKVYATTGESLFSYSLKDNKVEQLSKITGLSDFGVSAIAYSQDYKTLVIGYENGNIDLITGKSIVNIPELKKKTLSASKSIQDIVFDGKMAYLSCGFGIMLLDIEKKEIKDTYIFGQDGAFIQVNSCAILNNQIYAATEAGIFTADKTDPILVDYSHWIKNTDVPISGKEFKKLTNIDNVLYAVFSNASVGKDSIFYLKDSKWSSITLDESTDIYDISGSNGQFLVSTSSNLKYLNSDYSVEHSLWQYGDIGNALPRQSIRDTKGNIWVGDFGNGLIRISSGGSFDQIRPKGPLTSRIKSFYYINNQLYTVAGGTTATHNNLFNVGEYSIFSEEEWKCSQITRSFDFMVLRTDPNDKAKVYIGSYGTGLYIFKNGEQVSHFDETNSTLQNAIPGGAYVRIGGMNFDSEGNLWMSNGYVNNTLSVLKNNGEWKAFPYKTTIGTDVLGDVVVDDFNQIWVVLLDGPGIMVLNTNNTIDNTDDDKVIKFKPKNVYGETVTAYTLAKDMDGKIWVGTDYGPVVYENPDEVFDGNTSGSQPVITKNGTSYPLLGQEIVQAIAVDGANRKWLGTERGGAFLVSASGDSSLLQFNTDNSPIFSNTVNGIGIHGKTGEVFFGTDKGIVSYRSDATNADDDFGDVYAFPNPVRPNYHGLITVTGLIKDATVKITDITGNLVYETKTLGGQITWDGNNLDGRRVASGIYVIFCTNDDGTKTHITKLLFLN